jgi:MFS family permease
MNAAPDSDDANPYQAPAKVTAAPVSTGGAYKWLVVFMLWWVCFFNYADRQAIFSIFPTLESEFGFSKFQLGLIGSAFMWVYAFGAPLAGVLGDRLRRKDLILGGCLFWSFITAATGWCTQLWHFITVRALEGFGETFYFPASMSLVSDYHGPKTRSRAISLHQSSVYLGTIAGSWWGAWTAQYFEWQNGFYVLGATGMVLALVLYLSLKEPRRGQADVAAPGPTLSFMETLREVAKRPTVWLLMAAFVCANSVGVVFLTWTPTFLVEKFHFKLAAAGLSGTVYIHLASAVSAPIAGFVADRLALRIRGGRILVQMVGTLVGSVFVALVGSTPDMNTLLLAMTLFGLCKGLYDSNIFAALFDFVEPPLRSTMAGMLNTVGWAGGALGPIAIGYLAEHGRHTRPIDNMSEAIAWCGAVYLCAAMLLGAAFVFARRASRPV